MAENKPHGGEVSTLDLMRQIQKGVEQISDPAEIMQFFEQLQLSYSTGEEIHGGFMTLREGDREEFLATHQGQTVFVTDWEFFEGDYGEYVDLRLVSRQGKYRLSDGSSGLYKQLRQVTDSRIENPQSSLLPQAGLLVPKGFRSSGNYFYDDRTGEAIPNNKLDEVPAANRKPGKPVWYFVF